MRECFFPLLPHNPRELVVQLPFLGSLVRNVAKALEIYPKADHVELTPVRSKQLMEKHCARKSSRGKM